MTAAAVKKPSGKNTLVRLVHTAASQLKLSDDSYRALLERVTGKESSKSCTYAQLNDVMDEFKRLGWKYKKKAPKRAGKRPMADHDQARKIRALWLDLYHIAAVRDPTEAALAAYVERMTSKRTAAGREAGVEALQWIDSHQADRVIKGLRGWLERKGHVFPDARSRKAIEGWRLAAELPGAPGLPEKVAMLETQWRLLKDSGTMKFAFFADLGSWLGRYHGAEAPHFLDPARADSAIEDLGGWLRKALAKGGGS